MIEYFLKLIAHDQWANQKLLSALQAAPSVPPRTLELLGHMFAAHEFWQKRVHKQEVKDHQFWPPRTLEQLLELNDFYAQKWSHDLRNLSEPLESHEISFMAKDGSPRTVRVIDVLTQLHSHSIHHRAQIMLDMKSSGLAVVPTDYIVFCMSQAKTA